MNDQPYSNRELDERFKQHERLDDTRFADFRRDLLDKDEGILPRIEQQTMRTNGRVSELEKWKAYVLGFCGAITLLIIPVLLKLFVK